MILRALIVTMILFVLPPPKPNANDRPQAQSENAQVKRLPPSAFPQLPRNITRHLRARGCTMPQYLFKRSPHNVISGAFAQRGQRDWAVLCSRNGFSSILVFWNGRIDAVTELDRFPDDNFIQQEASGQMHYSRVIVAANKDYILSHYQAYKSPNVPKPPPIRHQGINDGYMEKASTVHYYYRGKWLKLQGAD